MNKQLVVARYKENIDWVNNITCVDDVVIYNKGDDIVDSNLKKHTIIQLPNFGREAHTYLLHIIENYYNLKDIVIFSQGDPFPHAPKLGKERSGTTLNEHLSVVNFNTIDCKSLFGEDYEESVDFLSKSLFEYCFKNEIPSVVNFSPGAQYIVPKSCILTKSLNFYKNQYDSLCVHRTYQRDGFCNAWTLERIWMYIFNKNYEERDAFNKPMVNNTMYNTKYNVEHLTQKEDQAVIGPLQDDEALFLYSIIRVTRIKNIIEVGFGQGHSALNFLKAVGSDGRVVSIDSSKVHQLSPNHTPILHNAENVEASDIPFAKADLVFYDCHNYGAQMSLHKKLLESNVITDDTILVLHDTGLHPYKVVGWSYEVDGGWVHQPVERRMVNTLKSQGWDAICLDTKKEDYDCGLLYRHGITIMKKFKQLTI